MPVAADVSSANERRARAIASDVRLRFALIGGLALWASAQGWLGARPSQYIAFALAVLLAAIPAVARRVLAAYDRCARPSARRRLAIAAIVFVVAAAYLLFDARFRGARVIPLFHDENMYLIQARILARGRLWMPAHPIGQFFASFYAFVKPAYTSMYFPGMPLAYVPAVWLGVPAWAWSCLVCAAVVAMVYRITAELVDGSAALIAALSVPAVPMFRDFSVKVMSHPFTLLLGLAITWAWLRWRAKQRWGWALLLGMLAGWAAVTRPLDALCFALPVGVAAAFDLRGRPARQWLLTGIATVIGAAPFLSLQAVINHAVTGSVLQTPFGLYQKTYWPDVGLGLHRHAPTPPTLATTTNLPQFRDYYYRLIVPLMHDFKDDGLLGRAIRRWQIVTQHTLPVGSLLMLLPAGVASLCRDRRQLAVFGVLPTLLLAYLFYPFFLDHYTLAVMPAMFLAILLGARWFIARARPEVAAGILLAIVMMALASLPEFGGFARQKGNNEFWGVLLDVDSQLKQLRQRPAVVLFNYASAPKSVHQEPVYNADVPTPDEAPIIRAHDLGPVENQKLFNYYAARQPQRTVFRYDRRTRTLTRLGTVAELARPSSTRPAQ